MTKKNFLSSVSMLVIVVLVMVAIVGAMSAISGISLGIGSSGSGGNSGGVANVKDGYNVTFMSNDEVYSVVSVKQGQRIKAPQSPKISGQYCLGWSTQNEGGDIVSFPYTPSENITLYAQWKEQIVLGFTGLKNASGELTWTDDIAGFEDYTETDFDRYVVVTSPLDDIFPFSEIHEVTDEYGNVFVSYPKCWIKWVLAEDGNIDGFKVSNVQVDEDYFISDAFLSPDESNYLDEMWLGKYEASGSTEKIYSKSGSDCFVGATRASFRKAARSYGSLDDYYKGYQQLDLVQLVLYNFLCMLYYRTADIQSVFSGRVSGGGVSVTGTCDSIEGLNGYDSVCTCVKMLGIENPYGNINKWVDGTCFYDNKIYIYRLPTQYKDNSSGAFNLGFEIPTFSRYVSALKPGSDFSTKSYVFVSSVNGTDTTFFRDQYNYDKDGVLLYCGGSFSYGGASGLWYFNSCSYSYTHPVALGGRLTRRPIEVANE